MKDIKNIMKRNKSLLKTQMREIIFLLFIFLSFNLYSEEKIIDSLFYRENWRFDEKWSCAKGIEVTNKSIKLYFNSSGMNDMAVFRANTGGINLEGMSKLEFSIKNLVNKNFNIAIAFVTEAGNKWWELPIREIKSGDNLIEYDLKEELFATKENGWIYSSKISGENNIKELGVVIYPMDKFEGFVILNDLRIVIDPSIILEKRKEEELYEEFENFESDNPWGAALWSGALDVRYDYNTISEGNRSIVFRYKGSGEHVYYWYFDKEKDISFYDKLRLDIYSPKKEVKQIRLNFMTGRNYIWHQSKYYDISSGWNKNYTIDITENWSPALDTQTISGIGIHIITTGKDVGEVYIDNIRLKRKKGTEVGKIDWSKKFKETFGKW